MKYIYVVYANKQDMIVMAFSDQILLNTYMTQKGYKEFVAQGYGTVWLDEREKLNPDGSTPLSSHLVYENYTVDMYPLDP